MIAWRFSGRWVVKVQVYVDNSMAVMATLKIDFVLAEGHVLAQKTIYQVQEKNTGNA